MADPRRLRIALAQMNSTVGDIEGNAARIAEAIAAARDAGAQLVVTPELALCGYPPEDLLLKSHFLAACESALGELASAVEGIVALVGYPERDAATHNSLAVLADGEARGSYRKTLLPNYGVFDERRYFEPGSEPASIDLAGARVGLTVCEDVWFPGPPASIEALAGAGLIVNPSASPYQRGKGMERERMIARRTTETGAAFALCNTVGGQDELVFDGHSVIVGPDGETIGRAAQFTEELLVCDVELPDPSRNRRGSGGGEPATVRVGSIGAFDISEPAGPARCGLAPPLEPEEAEVYGALKLGLADYVRKNGFEHVVFGLSGGIDSALVAEIAADTLGPDRVTAVIMPSPHSSLETQDDARRIAANLGIGSIEVPIEAAMAAYTELLAGPLAEATEEEPVAAGNPRTTEPYHTDDAARVADVTFENLQARIRGNVVMALSNRFGWLVLATGNKSEMSVGYATLYGDMAGGFALIKDVPKTLVYRLVAYRNGLSDPPPVPESVLERPPSAELRPDQRDTDSLPPYEVLDKILEDYVEGDRGRDEIVAQGVPADVVDDVMRMVDRAEYKRRQAPPGVKITLKAFGRDRRLPITNRFRE